MSQSEKKVLAQNRRARHDYFVQETWEAGIELKGTEVKSIRLGQIALKDCYAQVKNGEMIALGMHISPYEKGSFSNTDPNRPKRLLMHKAEIRKLNQAVMEKGLALIPLSVYLKDGRVKVLRQAGRHGQTRYPTGYRPNDSGKERTMSALRNRTWGCTGFDRDTEERGSERRP